MQGTLHGSDSRRYDRILALDLGKFNSVLCTFDPATAAHALPLECLPRQGCKRRSSRPSRGCALAEQPTGKNNADS
jgi:hypothetical protein